MKEADIKSEGGEQREGKTHFKKKGGGNKNKGKRQQSTADDAFRGVGFPYKEKALSCTWEP